jgi:tetratricopeptide (TPR) repeat protein
LQGAKHAFEEALEIQRETLRTSPSADEEEMGASTNQALLSIASTLCNLGSIELRWGNFEEASVALEEALLVSVIQSYGCAFHRL